ncbi:MAG: YfcE family phosphodiesterase [Sulfolobales archaeon]|nr:YfcE family phosphodiesterase [Sulfolobales archaeon]
MRVLVLSDSHIPERVDWLPKPVERYLLTEEFDAAIHAGDVVDEELIEFLRKHVSSELYVVRGNMDYLKLPRYVKVSVEGVEVGVVHGDRVYPRGNVAALTRVARALGVKLLVSGHTHSPFLVYDKSGVLHVNPGSVTGVWGGGGGSGVPSFAELRVVSRTVTVVIYELENDAAVRKNTGSYVL